MSKKNRNRQISETVETPVAETATLDQVAEVVTEPTPTPETAEPPVAEPPVDQVATAPVGRGYWVNDEVLFTPRRGFETVLYRALELGPRTVEEAVAALLASGDYARVAPEAAAKRPMKPAKFLVKTWHAAGVLKATAAN